MILRGINIEDSFLDLKNMRIKIEKDIQISWKRPISEHTTTTY